MPIIIIVFENSVDYFEIKHTTCLTYQIARFVEKLVDDKLVRGRSQTPVGADAKSQNNCAIFEAFS